MNHKAKCRLCGDIIESFHAYDFVSCKCEEISVDGGPSGLKCLAKDFKNFLRVDEEGNEILVQLQGESVQKDSKKIYGKDDLIKMLEEMVKQSDNLPKHAMLQPITHSDFYSFMLLIVSILKN